MAQRLRKIRTERVLIAVTKRDDVADASAPLPLEQLKRRDGMEVLRDVVSGALPAGPMNRTLDFFLTEVEPGRAVYRGNPKKAFFNLIGSVHGGWSAAILDSCIACAVHSMLTAGTGYTTVELKVNFVRAVTANCGPMYAEGKVINIGGRIGTAEGKLTDANGLLYAHATATCLFFDMSTRKRAR